MNWKTKARITRVCARSPWAESWYRLLQKRFGRLDGNPESRLKAALAILTLLRKNTSWPQRTYMEVGTGHALVAPLALFLAGAKEIWTYDLNKRLDPEITLHALRWMIDHEDYVVCLFGPFARCAEMRSRLQSLARTSSVSSLLKATNIHYMAPADAARTGLPNDSIDCHFSNTMLEHVTPEALTDIFREAHRVLASNGVAVHVIDPSDHFQHTDASISKINFLRFTEAEWRALAANRFAYCNRLRASDYVLLLTNLGFRIVDDQRVVDPDSLRILQGDFPVDAHFAGYSEYDLCTTAYTLLLRPSDWDAPAEISQTWARHNVANHV